MSVGCVVCVWWCGVGWGRWGSACLSRFPHSPIPHMSLMAWARVLLRCIYGLCSGDRATTPEMAALLDAEELAVYSASKPQRQVVFMKLQHLLGNAGLGGDEVSGGRGQVAGGWQEHRQMGSGCTGQTRTCVVPGRPAGPPALPPPTPTPSP